MENKEILLVNFGENQKRELERSLEKLPFTLAFHEDILSPFRITGKSEPDLVLIRLDSGDLRTDLAREFTEAHGISSSVPLVLLTPVNSSIAYARLLQFGVFHHIPVPCSRGHLLGRLQSILEHNGSDSPLDRDDHLRIRLDKSNDAVIIDNTQIVPLLLSLMENTVYQAKATAVLSKKFKSGKPGKRHAESNSKLQRMNTDELALEDELYRALKEGELALHYQPVIRLDTGELKGFESLIRWNHPDRGMVQPDDFIPVAEKSPVILDIGYWVIKEAAAQLKSWNKMFSALQPIQVNVNLSARQFTSPELGDRISGIIDESGIEPVQMAFEITESSFMEDMENANLMLLRLESENHQIYMDDFGTGFSSLSYLQHFPVDTLKIDKSFVKWMHIDEQSEIIVRTVVGLAHNLGKTVVAEGVETEEHYSMLSVLRCDYGQGYFFSRPMDSRSAEEFIASFRA